MPNQPERMRLDKWLWAARFFKTRGLASEQIDAGKVTVNGTRAKRAREITPGDEITFPRGDLPCSIIVSALSTSRGPAPVAQLLYSETDESIARRSTLQAQRQLAPEPAKGRSGRPTKHERRSLVKFRGD